MAKRKKYPKLPNGYGSIKYLGKGRRNPYGVYPPCKEFTLDGAPVTLKAICYVDDWMKGFAVLTAYKAGTYVTGMERELVSVKTDKVADGALVQRILADYNQASGKIVEKKKTFSEVYQEFYANKYERDKSRKYSKSTIRSTKAAYKNCSILHEKAFVDLRYQELQQVLDDCPLKHASHELILSLMHQMYEYAIDRDLVDKDYSTPLKINIVDDDDHGVPFTCDELRKLWDHKEDPTIEMLLIMCYSGFRIVEYKGLEVNLSEKYFKGGVKTKSGMNRIVPIHSSVFQLVQCRMNRLGVLLPTTPEAFRHDMYSALESIGIIKHTPHDCRHTFSMLCEHYSVSENDRKRMLGHSFGGDVTNGVYGHRTLEDLRVQIEKIKVCC